MLLAYISLILLVCSFVGLTCGAFDLLYQAWRERRIARNGGRGAAEVPAGYIESGHASGAGSPYEVIVGPRPSSHTGGGGWCSKDTRDRLAACYRAEGRDGLDQGTMGNASHDGTSGGHPGGVSGGTGGVAKLSGLDVLLGHMCDIVEEGDDIAVPNAVKKHSLSGGRQITVIPDK